MTNIKVRLQNNIWTNALPYQEKAFLEFKRNRYNDYFYNQGDIKFRLSRINDKLYGPIYLIREDNTMMPIIDWNDVKIFIRVNNILNWYEAEQYLKEAYFDYIYSNQEIGYYHLLNRSFIIARNTNNSIYYKYNDGNNNQVRICDNSYARAGYLGFYHRMTSFVDFEVSSLNYIIQLKLPLDLIIKKSDDCDRFCVICNEFEQNIKFLPCNHTSTCSKCYVKLIKHHECPICKQTINQIVKYII